MSSRPNTMPGYKSGPLFGLWAGVCLGVSFCHFALGENQPVDPKIIFFENNIRPVLADTCYGCHSKAKNKSKGDLQVDSLEALLKGGEMGAAIIPGDANGSLLMEAIRYQNPDFQMPPDDPLSKEQIQHFESWINAGAVFPKTNPTPFEDTPSWWDAVDRKQLLSSDTPPQEAVDHYILQSLKEQQLFPAPKATDNELIRRLTLDLAGRPPTPSEINQYLFDPSADRTERYIGYLMQSSCYQQQQVEEFNWHLMDGKGGGLRNYLETALGENRSWDQIFKEIILADYSNESAKGAPEFIKERIRNIDRLTNDVSVRFFGVNISCAQCHDHPNVSDWTQESYYGMKSFFGRTFENGGFVAEREYGQVSFKTTQGDTRKAPLQFIDGKQLEESSINWSDEQRKAERELLKQLKEQKKPVPNVANSRRAKLVEEGLASDQQGYFARAMVNRVWHRLMGSGLVEPLDQMHGDNTPSHPELLLWLSEWFTQSDYDLNGLIEGIVMSRAYQRSSAWMNGDRPPKNTYAAANLRVLTPRQYAASLLMGAASPENFDGCDPSNEKHHQQLSAILGSLTKTASWFERPGDGFYFSVDEALQLSNGSDVQKILFGDQSSGFIKSLMNITDPKTQVEKAYLNILHRVPTQTESDTMAQFLTKEGTQLKNQLESMVWVLLTSPENRLNH